MSKKVTKPQPRREGPLRVQPDTLVEAHALRDLVRREGTRVLPPRLRDGFDDGCTLADIVRAGLQLLREQVESRV